MAGLDGAKAREAFAIPEEFEPVAAMTLGYPGEATSLPEPYLTRESQPRVRKPVGEFTHLGGWGATGKL
jgi:hypothetical protein